MLIWVLSDQLPLLHDEWLGTTSLRNTIMKNKQKQNQTPENYVEMSHKETKQYVPGRRDHSNVLGE